jgi:hypothetical protein
MVILGWSLICGTVTLNIIATTMLVRSGFETKGQKIAQISLIWLVPLIGAIVIIAVLANSSAVDRPPAAASDASGASLYPGSDGDLNRYGSENASAWGEGGHGSHGGGGGGHAGD